MKPLRPSDLVILAIVLVLLGVALAVVGLPRKARAQTECDFGKSWRGRDTVLTAGFEALNWMDWKQTKQAQGQGGVEFNPKLGRHPSGAAVDTFFLVNGLGTAVIAWVLPEPWRQTWLGFQIGVHFMTVQDNWTVGLRAGF